MICMPYMVSCCCSYKRCPIHDTPKTNISRWIKECTQFIDEARKKGGMCSNASQQRRWREGETNRYSAFPSFAGRVLVHCQMGASRSVSIATAYMMKKKKIRYILALNMIAQKRPRARPNPGFLRQLKEYEKLLGIKTL